MALSSLSLYAAIALAACASLLLCPSLQRVAASPSRPPSAQFSRTSPSPSNGIPAPLSSPAPAPFPSPAPAPAPAPSSGGLIPRAPPRPHENATQNTPAPAGRSADFQIGRTVGVVLIAAAGALQAVVVVFLLVKRKQMLKLVRSYDMNGPSETRNDAP